MSVKVDKTEAGGRTDTIDIGNKTINPSRRKLHLKVTSLLAGVLVLLAIILTGSYLIFHHDVKPATLPKTSASIVTPPKFPAGITTVSDQADYLAFKDDYTAAQAMLAKQAAGETGATLQTTYMQQASIAINAKKYTDAMDYAKKADKILPTDQTAALMAQIAGLQNDVATAQSDYELAISRLDKTSRTYNISLGEYQEYIQELKQ